MNILSFLEVDLGDLASTRLRTVTVLNAVTVPSPLKYTGRSPRCAVATNHRHNEPSCAHSRRPCPEPPPRRRGPCASVLAPRTVGNTKSRPRHKRRQSNDPQPTVALRCRLALHGSVAGRVPAADSAQMPIHSPALDVVESKYATGKELGKRQEASGDRPNRYRKPCSFVEWTAEGYRRWVTFLQLRGEINRRAQMAAGQYTIARFNATLRCESLSDMGGRPFDNQNGNSDRCSILCARIVSVCCWWSVGAGLLYDGMGAGPRGGPGRSGLRRSWPMAHKRRRNQQGSPCRPCAGPANEANLDLAGADVYKQNGAACVTDCRGNLRPQ